MFASYSGDGKAIEGEYLEKLFTDLKLDMEDPVTVAICYCMSAKEGGRFTKDEFKRGCTELKCDTLDKWYKVIPDLKKNVKNDPKLAEKIYSYAFEFN